VGGGVSNRGGGRWCITLGLLKPGGEVVFCLVVVMVVWIADLVPSSILHSGEECCWAAGCGLEVG